MNEDVFNLVESFKHKAVWRFEPGDICIYREGIVKGIVKVLEKTLGDKEGKYRLRTVKSGKFPLPEKFDVDCVYGYEGWCWSLSSFPEAK